MRPVVLCILDGWGLSPTREGNAVALGATPNFDRIWKDCPHATLVAHGPDVGLPEGQIFHAAGASAGGWMVVAVHETQASWERFRDDVLRPALARGVSGGFATPPEERAFETHGLDR